MKLIAEHIKSGRIYSVMPSDCAEFLQPLVVINTTNASDQQRMIVYMKDGKYFVREQKEFYEKFKMSISLNAAETFKIDPED